MVGAGRLEGEVDCDWASARGPCQQIMAPAHKMASPVLSTKFKLRIPSPKGGLPFKIHGSALPVRLQNSCPGAKTPSCATPQLAADRPKGYSEAMDSKENLADAGFESLEAMMIAYATDAVKQAASQGEKLDFSESSIAVVERCLALLAPGDQPPEDVNYLSRI